MTKKEKAKYEIALKRIIGYCTSNLCYMPTGATLAEIRIMREIAQEALGVDKKEILFPTELKFYKKDGKCSSE